MIPIIMMIAGGILILLSIIGIILFIFEPFRRTYRIAIKGEDDYAHYTSPRNFAMRQKARRNYCIGCLVMFLLGFILSYIGAYLTFGERGFGFLFSTQALEETNAVDVAVSSELEDHLDENGNYKDDEGNIYSNYIVINGHEVTFKETTFGDTEELRAYIQGIKDMGKVYVVDGYAASSTYNEVIDILDEYGFDYEPK